MLTGERQALILDRLRRDGRVLATPLAGELRVSEDTIRRDLRELAADGRLKRVHGGALPLARAAVTTIVERASDASEEKRALAAAGARLVAPGQVLILDGGTTNLLLAALLPVELDATVVTTSPAVALALASHQRLEVVLTGGRLLPRTGTVAGPETVAALRAFRADLCFLGVCSLDAEAGITCAVRDEVFTKRAMIEAAGEVVVMATADKLDAAAAHVVAPVTEVARLFVAEAVPASRLRRYRQRGVEVELVRTGG